MACIAIDCRFAALPVGLGTYTRELVSELVPLLKGHHVCLLVRSTDEPWLSTLDSSIQQVEIPYKHYSLQEQLLLPRRLQQLSVDLLYSLHFNVPYFCPVPFVATVHDLILHHYPNSAGFLKRTAYKVLMARAISRAKAVVAVSEYTARDVQETYGVLSQIVTEGVHKRFRTYPESEVAEVLKRYKLPESYFLYAGGNKQHKNIQTLVDAHRMSESQTPLVLITSPDAQNTMKLHPGVEIRSNVPEEDLPYFYCGARCFVTASLFEGFCLPIIEARSCGCPVIASNVTAIPEVAGPDTHLVEPTVEAFTAAMRHPPIESSLPDERFSWANAAKAVSVILNSALDG